MSSYSSWQMLGERFSELESEGVQIKEGSFKKRRFSTESTLSQSTAATAQENSGLVRNTGVQLNEG